MKKSQNDSLYKVGKYEQFTDSINFKKTNKLPKVKNVCLELAHNRSRANTRAITAAKTIKNAYSNASFSSVTTATKSLGLSDNGFKTA